MVKHLLCAWLLIGASAVFASTPYTYIIQVWERSDQPTGQGDAPGGWHSMPYVGGVVLNGDTYTIDEQTWTLVRHLAGGGLETASVLEWWSPGPPWSYSNGPSSQDGNGNWLPQWRAIGTGKWFFIARQGDTPNTPALPVVSVTIGDHMSEPNTKGHARVYRTGPTTAPLTVKLLISDGVPGVDPGNIATAGVDFVKPSQTVTIDAGQSYKEIEFVPIDDLLAEGTEIVLITVAADAAYTVDPDPTHSTATMYLYDDDTPPTTQPSTQPTDELLKPKQPVDPPSQAPSCAQSLYNKLKSKFKIDLSWDVLFPPMTYTLHLPGGATKNITIDWTFSGGDSFSSTVRLVRLLCWTFILVMFSFYLCNSIIRALRQY